MEIVEVPAIAPETEGSESELRAQLAASREEVAALRAELERERGTPRGESDVHAQLAAAQEEAAALESELSRACEALVALDARVRAADDESSKALEALRLLETKIRGGGKPEVALNGGGGVDDTATVGMAVLRGELRSCEVQMMATASLLAQLRDINLS